MTATFVHTSGAQFSIIDKPGAGERPMVEGWYNHNGERFRTTLPWQYLLLGVTTSTGGNWRFSGTSGEQVGPDWTPLHEWIKKNPRPVHPATSQEVKDWFEEEGRLIDRIWVAACLPQYKVMDPEEWPDEDVALARRLVARHTCGVCGRHDDDRCIENC